MPVEVAAAAVAMAATPGPRPPLAPAAAAPRHRRPGVGADEARQRVCERIDIDTVEAPKPPRARKRALGHALPCGGGGAGGADRQGPRDQRRAASGPAARRLLRLAAPLVRRRIFSAVRGTSSASDWCARCASSASRRRWRPSCCRACAAPGSTSSPARAKPPVPVRPVPAAAPRAARHPSRPAAHMQRCVWHAYRRARVSSEAEREQFSLTELRPHAGVLSRHVRYTATHARARSVQDVCPGQVPTAQHERCSAVMHGRRAHTPGACPPLMPSERSRAGTCAQTSRRGANGASATHRRAGGARRAQCNPRGSRRAQQRPRS